MIVVADTSPINYLVQIGQVELLRLSFGRVLVPQAVLHELQAPGAPTPVWEWASSLPPWVDVSGAVIVTNKNLHHLDRGEREAIQLAIDRQASLLLIDEADGRRAAEEHGLLVAGTLRILSDAAAANLLDFETALMSLRNLGFWASDDVIRRARLRAKGTE